jgi:hypothetical protein
MTLIMGCLTICQSVNGNVSLLGDELGERFTTLGVHYIEGILIRSGSEGVNEKRAKKLHGNTEPA